MPPKSPNPSGKSTPTRARPVDKKDEEENPEENEEARLKAEEEEKQRQIKEAQEQLEQKLLEELIKIRDLQERETTKELENILSKVEQVINDKRANAQWKRFMRCDGRPDPTSTKEINTFIALSKENGNPDINVVLEDAKLILTLISELNTITEDPALEESLAEEYKQTVLSLQKLLLIRYNEATLKMLKEASFEADSETGNLQKVIKADNETLMIWGNLNKNPRFKGYEFEQQNLMFELPKVLALADVAVRVLHTDFDHYSKQCNTFHAKKPKTAPEEVEEEVEVPQEAGDENAENANVEDAETKSVSDGRKSEMSASSDKDKAEENPAEENEEKKEKEDEEKSRDGESRVSGEIRIEIEEDEILDPDVVDLRQFSPLGGVYHVDLLKLPPQPKVVNGWTLTQIIDHPLSQVKYPSEHLGKSSSRAPSATPEAREGESVSPSKTPMEQQQPPIGVTLTLPEDVAFFEEPQVAKWDDHDKHWKTSGIVDPSYDEEKRVLNFKTSEFGTFCLMQETHLNMPFQSWELRPRGFNSCLLTVTAAIAEIHIEIQGKLCRLMKGEEPMNELAKIYDHWMSPKSLIAQIRSAGVNIFPASDASKFATVQEKDVNMDVVYQQMALLSSSFAFSWSKWNSSGAKNRILFQTAPLYVINDVRPVPDDDWSIYACADDRCYKLALQEYDEEYAQTLAADAAYHCDVIHALRSTSLKGDASGKLLTSLVERSRSVDPFYADAVYRVLAATKVISFS